MSGEITRGELEARLGLLEGIHVPVYFTVASHPRPAVPRVQWIGPVQPTNAIDNDIWVEVT